LNKELETVKVPKLVGEVYSDYLAQELDEFNIQLRPQQYDSEYEKGVIMSQEPAGGTEVKKGADIWITVSMGAEPEEKIMENYVGARQEGVESALKGQGFAPIFFDEASELPVGVVIRTDPEAGTELEEGQAIRIFVSSGPDVVTAKMLNVVGKDKEHAVELLHAKGFDNVRTVTVDSKEPAGTVVYQSETAGDEIDVNTEIILEISAGPVEEETEPEHKQEDPEETQEPVYTISQKTITFALPVRETSYTVTILRDGQPYHSDLAVTPDVALLNITVEGYGTMTFDLGIDGAVYSSMPVEFAG
jgi:serine/threonine-protein kinase